MLRALTKLSGWSVIPLILIVVAASYFSYRTIAQEYPNPKATSDLPQAFQSALDDLRKKYGFPGATAAYILQDGTLGVAATGFADIEANRPMTVRSRMLAASIGKTFVGATTVVLSREGLLDLDAPISQWLGDRQWFTRLPNHNTITLRHLLTHRSGLPDHVYMQNFTSAVAHEWQQKDNPFPPERLIQFILDQPALFEAGKGWAYSDSGYILVGLVLEEATKKSYYELIEARFLRPLGLTWTQPSDRRILPELAAGYVAQENAFGFPRKTIGADGAMVWHPGLEWTGGGLISNSRDLVLWGSALFGGRAMPGNYLDEMLDADPISTNTPNISYGIGVAIYNKGPFGAVYGHNGWIPGYCSTLRYYRDHGIAIAFQINTDIGIVDNTSSVMNEMETRLAEIVISSTL